MRAYIKEVGDWNRCLVRPAPEGDGIVDDVHRQPALALLPPAKPPQPTVGPPPPGGTATPSGSWNSGQQVRYALMAKSTKGPSPASEWSQPLTIGATVGAVVGGITAVDGADTLVVLRQFRANTTPPAAWSDNREQVAALAGPFPPTYTDTNLGGDPGDQGNHYS